MPSQTQNNLDSSSLSDEGELQAGGLLKTRARKSLKDVMKKREEKMQQVKCGIIGVGTWGQHLVRACSLHPFAAVAAICDVNEERARAVAKTYDVESWYTDYNQMLEKSEIDAVFIATPDFAHLDPAIACAEAKKHLLVEKPLAMSVEDCETIIDAAEKNDVKLMVDFSGRWVIPFLHAKRSVEKGELGDLMHAYIRLSDTLFVPRKMLAWPEKTSELWFLSCHCIDILRWILDDEVKSVFALSQSKVLKSEGINCPDYFQTLLEFQRGTSAVMENSWLLPEKSSPTVLDYRLDIIGSKGAIYINLAQSSAIVKYIEEPTSESGWPYYIYPDLFFVPNAADRKPRGPHASVVQAVWDFVDVIGQDKQPSATGYDGLAATKIILAIGESVRDKKIVEVEMEPAG